MINRTLIFLHRLIGTAGINQCHKLLNVYGQTADEGIMDFMDTI